VKLISVRLAALAIMVIGGLAFHFACQKNSEGTAAAGSATAATATASAPASPFVNTRCPILGTAISPANVPESLTRIYKGQKVAFCCDGCPQAWDKLTDAEKDAKLKAAK
jgi:hypothetical protein